MTTTTTVKVPVTPEVQEDKPPTRTPEGKFLKGVSGNPAGRTKGAKNKITLERLLLEEKLREALSIEGPKLMRRAVRMALSGNDRVMRVLLDKMLATPRGEEDTQSGDRDIQVIVNNYTKPEKPGKLIEGEVIRKSIPTTTKE